MINNKHVVITGASSGIGLALATQLLTQNNKISVCARNSGTLNKAFNASPKIFACATDVSNENQCQQFIKKAIAQHGEIDILINNAGISMRAMFDGINLQVLKNLMDINYWGTVYCTYYALPSIKKTKGVIASVSSIAGYRGLPARTGYSSSKFAMQGFMESLRTELLHTGVHVMWVCPGFISTNIRNVALNENGDKQIETPLQEDKLMSAATCANIIIKGIEKRKRTIVMTFQGKLTVFINKFFPSMADKLVFNHFAKEPNSPLK